MIIYALFLPFSRWLGVYACAWLCFSTHIFVGLKFSSSVNFKCFASCSNTRRDLGGCYWCVVSVNNLFVAMEAENENKIVWVGFFCAFMLMLVARENARDHYQRNMQIHCHHQRSSWHRPHCNDKHSFSSSVFSRPQSFRCAGRKCSLCFVSACTIVQSICCIVRLIFTNFNRIIWQKWRAEWCICVKWQRTTNRWELILLKSPYKC